MSCVPKQFSLCQDYAGNGILEGKIGNIFQVARLQTPLEAADALTIMPMALRVIKMSITAPPFQEFLDSPLGT